jgi:sulfatase modifying factor 1
MGSSDEEIERLAADYPEAPGADYAGETPKHPVAITRPFLMAAHEVTIGQFRRFVDETGYTTSAERSPEGAMGWDPDRALSAPSPRSSWRDPGYPQSDNHPVVNVNAGDIRAFCDWLSQKDGRRFRLPTEAEWEYGCRAGTDTRYSFGDDPLKMAEFGNFGDASLKTRYGQKQPDWPTLPVDDGFVHTAPVGRFAPNAWGLYDMHGNVSEICRDWYDPDYYANSSDRNPIGPEEGSKYVNRGGHWFSRPWIGRSADRMPGLDSHANGSLSTGFRIVADEAPSVQDQAR